MLSMQSRNNVMNKSCRQYFDILTDWYNTGIESNKCQANHNFLNKHWPLDLDEKCQIGHLEEMADYFQLQKK